MTIPPAESLPPAPAPQKIQPWIIVVIVVVLLCCFCVGLLGLLFAFCGPILNELGVIQSQLPPLII